ncbi:MAG: S8 family serine peptidase [Terracidiphilus sp.]|nr:S8 family serine peptidase [Terracidiphilus sp.]
MPDGSTLQFNGPVSYVAGPSSLHTKIGTIQAAIKLSDPPLVVAVGANAKQNGTKMTAAQQQAYLVYLKQKQDAVMSQVAGLGGVEIGRVSKAHNALIVSIDASQTHALMGISGVVAVRPVPDFQTSAINDGTPDLYSTLSYVGASSVQLAGNTGAGIKIAMLDTGIDYTHYNLGGTGNVADYNSAVAVAGGTPPPSLFPTSKVVGGYDFTGEVWPNGPLAPDPNPIDLNGHGTHTADIAGGHSLDGVHVGAAPGSQLYAVKVCSSVSSSCSGVAILEGLDFALDPTNSGTLNYPVDIISMSIGGSFGMREDDSSEAFTDIVNFGIVGVVSAGNDGDIPYIVAHPAATPEVLAVAATTSVVASGIPLVINSPVSIAGTYPNTATVDWAPITSTTTANVVYVGRGCPGDTLLASPSGSIALVDRGTCAVSLKVDYVANAGAVGVLLGLVAPGDAVSFSNGGGSHFVPTLVITQSNSNVIKTALGSSAVNATISSNNAISLAGNVASYSSRGPNYSYNMLKPDMSAPGTMSAAQPGTGNGETTESGTSFSCPITAGSAALLLGSNHALTPLDIKARLMETTNNVYNNAATMPGVLAPMSRAGSGELRVDHAFAGSTAAWDASNPLAVSLSFGAYRLNANQTYKKKVVVRNYSSVSHTYAITNTYRDAPNTTGFTLSFPGSVSVPPNSSSSFTLSATVNAAALPAWTLNGGVQGGNGELLNTVEYAGYLTFTDGPETAHLPWHILPHQAANVTAASSLALGGNAKPLAVSNTPAPIAGQVDTFSLTGIGTQFPASVLPAPGSDYAVVNLRAVGLRLVCLTSSCTTFGVQFAVNTFGQRSHPDAPAEFDVLIDANNDGTNDYDVFNADIGFETTGTNSGQNGVFVADLAAGTASGPYYYSTADLDSANMILTVPVSALTSSAGGPPFSVTAPFNYSVLAFDNYYTGNLTDSIGPMKYEMDMPQSYASSTVSVPVSASSGIEVYPNNASFPYFTGPYNGNSPSQSGLLLMYTNGKDGREADLVTVTP